MIFQRSETTVLATALLKTTIGLRMRLISILIQVAIPVLGYFYRPRPWPYTLEDKRKMPEGSLGKTIADWLDRESYALIPKYENHDVKHVLSGYPMTGLGEIRLQAFLFGNGSRSLATIGVFAIGLILLPEYWTLLFADMRRGRYCRPLHKLDLISLLPKNLKSIKKNLEL